jgi:hypothetical protein
VQLALVITGQSAISADPCGALDDLQDPTARARNCHRGAGSLIAGPFILKIFADAVIRLMLRRLTRQVDRATLDKSNPWPLAHI